jgi:LPXTG-motif cell wall-anchored protein
MSRTAFFRPPLVVVLVMLTLALAGSPAAALPAFGTAPLSLPGVGGVGPGRQVTITSVTVGHHSGFDRVVFTSRNGRPSVTVKYVSQVTQDPSGKPVSLKGSAFLLVTLRNTTWQSAPSPQPTLTPGFPALRQLKGAGEFEAVASYGIGQASKAGFRVFALSDPNRVVIDLAAPPDGNLPRTGSSVPPITALGLGLVILGLGSYLLARRRPAIVNGSYRSQVRRHRR